MTRKHWGSAVIASAQAWARLWPDHVAAARPVEGRPDGRPLARRTAARMLRVLIADDSPDAVGSLSTLVRQWGHDVHVACTAVEVVEITSTYRPDVVLLDITIPQMDGLELARQLRRLPALDESLLVAITGNTDEAHRLLGADAGFDLYLIKNVEPLTLEELMRLEINRHEDERRFSAPPPRPYGILVVDDEPGVRGVLREALRQRGFAVWLAADGHDALEQYRHHREAIDLVLLDVRMPTPDGPQTLAMLRQVDPQVSFCFMSGELGDYTADGLRALGAAAVIAKPFRVAEAAQRLWELAGPCGMGRCPELA
jgi:CheY-like chemotaxis protein